MDTGSSNNRRGVRGMSGTYGGEEPQPQDAKVGGWFSSTARADGREIPSSFRARTAPGRRRPAALKLRVMLPPFRRRT